MARIGDTVRLTFTFRNFAGELTDSSTPVMMRVYGQNRSQIGDTVNVSTSGTRTGAGTYEINYLIPDVVGGIVIEASGTIDGLVELAREVVAVAWA